MTAKRRENEEGGRKQKGKRHRKKERIAKKRGHTHKTVHKYTNA